MKKYTIEDLAAGRVATFIADKSEIPDLEKLLRLAFPKEKYDAYERYLSSNSDEYYFAYQKDNNFWSSFRETNLPTQYVKDFLIDLEEEWEPKPGEICLVSYPFGKIELEFIAKADFKGLGIEYLFYDSLRKNPQYFKKENIKPLPQKLKLTLKQIADKFGVEVDRLEVVND